MEEEASIRGTLRGGHVLVADKSSISRLSQDGYGDADPDGYHLKPFEALYLISVGRLVLAGSKRAGFEGTLERFRKDDPDILSKYLIYRDLRSRGYVAKDGFGFGTDFRVYDRGDFGDKGAKFLIFGLNEGRREGAGTFCKRIDQMAGMGKEPVVAVIERRGEVIYYKLNRVRFPPNRP
ncbi:MAG: tRNA-intron lyase [Nitrosopumilaceae archaeon]|nr:tRNA-intron lyase [Nitrosopumilaceae archaeon]